MDGCLQLVMLCLLKYCMRNSSREEHLFRRCNGIFSAPPSHQVMYLLCIDQYIGMLKAKLVGATKNFRPVQYRLKFYFVYFVQFNIQILLE